MQKTKNVLAVIFGIIVSLIILEFCLPLVMPVPKFLKLEVNEIHGSGVYKLSSNPQLLYEPKPNTGDYNALGYKGQLVALAKPADKKRIIFMGDSVVDGITIPIGQRFTELLEKQMGPSVEVVNLGVSGYNLRQEYEYLKERGLSFQPDIVIFGITFNDEDLLPYSSGELMQISNAINKSGNGDFLKMYYSAKNSLDSRLLASNIYRTLKYYTSTKRKQDTFADTVGYRLRTEEVQAILADLKNLAEKHKFNLHFVFLPVDASVPMERMNHLELLAEEAGISSLDLNELVSKHMGSESRKNLFIGGNDPCHFSERGHAIVAMLIEKYLEAESIKSPVGSVNF